MKVKIRDITDTQVLKQLRTRRVRLQMELERVNLAIKAFEDIKDIDPLDAVLYDLDEEDLNVAKEVDLAEAILMYNPKMTAEKKIEYALRQLKTAEANEIAEYLLKVDGHIKDATKFFNNITYVASRMYKIGKLGADKAGKKNRYKLLK